jgi:hypothetical protein
VKTLRWSLICHRYRAGYLDQGDFELASSYLRNTDSSFWKKEGISPFCR